MATKKKARPKKAAKRPVNKPARGKRSAARKSAARKGTAKKSATKQAAGRKPARKASSTLPRRAKQVRAVVEEKARQGLNVAREGLERLKQSTYSLVEEVKERIGGGDDTDTPDAGRGGGEVR